ncbi:MAG: hypothetical protein RMK45_06200 [Armatimonadota bacterium]|nr:hypothetical protein [Armatimonadota bacterium]
MTINTGESLDLLRKLLLQYAPVGIADTSLLLSSQRQAEHLFPDVLVLLSDARVGALRFSLAQECLAAFHAGWFSARQFDDYASHVLTAYREVESHLLPYQNPEALRTMWDNEKYLKWRWAGGVMLDLMGYFPTPEVLEALQQALQRYIDPYLLLYAVVSLICYAEVDPQVIYTVAACAETRERLYGMARELRQVGTFPCRVPRTALVSRESHGRLA